MTRYARITSIVAVLGLATATLGAQGRSGSAGPVQVHRPGWTFTPAFGIAETYDDNISLFGVGTAEGRNNDYITTYFPEAALDYAGKHSFFGMTYSGTFLDYGRFASLNRWDQRGHIEIERQETAHLKWMAHATGAMMPSTDLVDLGGIPFRHTGARTADGRGGFEYALNPHNAVTSSLTFQSVDFDRPEELRAELRGGRILESLSTWRHKIDSRFGFGADYSFRRSHVVGDGETFDLHQAQAAIDYELSHLWTLSGAGGAVYMQATPTVAARTGPAYRVSLERRNAETTFQIGYTRSYIPSFGFGGTVQNQEGRIGFRTPLFGSRHFYTEQSAVLRDDQPLTNLLQQLPLRSLRTYSILGWTPQPWVRIEAFYARVDQTSLRVGGQIYRNRAGLQIVTSKPMRMQ